MSSAAARRKLLMPHEARQALIRKPFHIAYIPPQKRWGGVQIINDEDWMRDANAWRKKYAQDGDGDDSQSFGIGNGNSYRAMGGVL